MIREPPFSALVTTSKQEMEQQHVILFYKYHPLSPDWDVTEQYRSLLVELCQALDLSGRILVGCSKTEGINGTLAGEEENVRAFTQALLPPPPTAAAAPQPVVVAFREKAAAFFESIGEDILLMESVEDFKWSTTTADTSNVFPDLHIRLVSELIGTGGTLSDIAISETSVGYLTPEQWHQRMLARKEEEEDDTVVIDCRNVKEHQIGHFEGALDPGTNTFEQFPKWVRENEYQLAGKKVMMYCTGGIRCEKASAYIRKAVPDVREVSHLKGGIHKYLEEFDNGELWLGKNFVFDGRWAMPSQTSTVVGECLECKGAFDRFDPHCVCTVCREPTLVCDDCKTKLVEYHCARHANLKHCFFTNLDRGYSREELKNQITGLQRELDAVAIGRKFKQKRRGLLKQILRVKDRLNQLSDPKAPLAGDKEKTTCPNCGSKEICSGICWGFNGKQTISKPAASAVNTEVRSARPKQPTKRPRRSIEEFAEYSCPPGQYRDSTSGVRVPPCSIRVLECFIKAKWCSLPVLQVVQEQFFVGQPQALQSAIKYGLLRLNGQRLTQEMARTRLKTSDSLSRIVHWHEAPVVIPEERLRIQTIEIPISLLVEDAAAENSNRHVLYVCNKPSSVPVHPAGPYLANSLTLMAAAQLGLSSIQPLHRIDRATSGLTLLCDSTLVARKFQQRLAEPNSVRKLYLAQVSGEFPVTKVEAALKFSTCDNGGTWECSAGGKVSVSANIYTADPAAGIRVVDATRGKSATSIFQRLSFDGRTSILACWLVSGRNHQLRVHLQWLNFPIVGDLLYGGVPIDSNSRLGDTVVVGLMETAAGTATGTIPDEVDARKACPSCNDDVSTSFTRAQLLQGGHEIRLHALRYSVLLGTKEPPARLDFEVDTPRWASPSLDEKLLQDLRLWNQEQSSAV